MKTYGGKVAFEWGKSLSSVESLQTLQGRKEKHGEFT